MVRLRGSSFFSDYVKAHGDSPTYSFFSAEEEAFNKRRAGYRADLAHPCTQSVSKWREAGMIEPFAPARLKYWSDIAFADTEGFTVDGKIYVVPVDWGATGLTYRTDLVSEAEASTLQSFAQPKFQGRVSLPDNVDDAYALGFLAIGVYDWAIGHCGRIQGRLRISVKGSQECADLLGGRCRTWPVNGLRRGYPFLGLGRNTNHNEW